MGTLTRASSEQLDAYERKDEPDGSGDRLMREAIRRNQMHSDALRPMSAKMSQPATSKISAMSTFGNERAMDSEMCLSSLNLEKSIKARKEARAPKMRWLKVITSVLFSGLKRANSKQMRSSMYLGHHAINGVISEVISVIKANSKQATSSMYHGCLRNAKGPCVIILMTSPPHVNSMKVTSSPDRTCHIRDHDYIWKDGHIREGV